MKREYWMKMDAMTLADRLENYKTKFFSTSMNPIWQTWNKNSIAYFSNVLDSQSWTSALNFKGEQGELVEMKVPEARALIRNLITLITKQRLAFASIAMIKDRDVVEEMRIANALLEQVVDEQTLDMKQERLVELGLVLGISYLATTWRTDKGEAYAVDENGGILYKGALEMSVFHLSDVIYDFTIEEWEDLPWLMLRRKRNRWDLIEQHKALEEPIIALESVNDQVTSRDYFGMDENDLVYVYELYHRPTPALPNGRMMMFSDRNSVYFDGINAYGTIPVETFKPEGIFGMSFGYPALSSLLPLQEMFDHEYSAVATNHSAFAVQNITAARGSEIQVEELLGMNLISYTPTQTPGGGKPEALQLTADSPNSFKFMDQLGKEMGRLANVNEAVRGELGANASGVAIATLTTNALEFLNSYTKALSICFEKSMMHAINAYKKFCKLPEMVKIVGKNNQTIAKEFVGNQLEPIESIKIQSVNPLMQTISGRLELASKLAQEGMIKSTQEYVAVLDGQPLSRMFESDLKQSDLKEQENQDFLEGKQVFPLATDDHAGHIQKHSDLLNDTNVRRNSDMIDAIMNHIEQHLSLFKQTDPMLMAMVNTGKPPEQTGVPQNAENAGGGAPPQGGPDQVAQSIAMPTNESASPAQDILNRGQ